MSDTTAYDPVLLAVATAKAAEQERAAIVAWLRGRGDKFMVIGATFIAQLADLIERGEHRK